MNRLKKGIAVGIISLGTILLAACGGESSNTEGKKEISIGYPTAGNTSIGGIIGWAEEKGYLEEELSKVGYTVKLTGFSGAGPAVNEAFVSGQVNIAAYADFPGLIARAGGNDVDLIGLTSEEVNAEIIVTKDSDITSIKDLKGKKVGFTKGTYSQKFLYDALQSEGLSIDDIEPVNLASEAESSLLTGAIDALCTVDGLTSRLRSQEGAKLISRTTDQEEWGSTSGIFVGKAFAAENKEAIVAFFKALERAKADIKEDYEPYIEANAQLMNIPLDIYRELTLLDDGAFDYISLKVTDSAKKKIDLSIDFLLEEKLIENDIDIDALVDNSYYEEAVAE